MVLDKPIEEITFDDLQNLIDNKIIEQKTIEYKQSYSHSYDGKKKFLANASSFANASGGHIIIGIKAKSGIPIELCGLESESVDGEKLRLEHLLRDCIEPRIPGIQIKNISINSSEDVLVLFIPKSWSQPHVVTIDKHWRFYSRTSSGNYQLDVSELKSAFLLSETIAEKIRLFRTERLGKIIAGETPIQLTSNIKSVIHLSSIDSFHNYIIQDLRLLENSLYNDENKYTGFKYLYNFDGLLSYKSFDSSNYNYTQLFRNGIIEAVMTINNIRIPLVNKSNTFPMNNYEVSLFNSLTHFLSLQKQIGVQPPIFIMLSLVNVNGLSFLGESERLYGPGEEHYFDRNIIILPEIQCDSFGSNLIKILKPVMDIIWNAGGYSEWENYEKWIDHYKKSPNSTE